MKKPFFYVLPVLGTVLLQAVDQSKIPPIPSAVTGNAVASLKGGVEVYSLMGIGAKKTWDDVTNKMYVLGLKSGRWSEGKPVPGVAGRLGAAAIGAKNKVYVFGGYVIDGQGGEFVVADANSYLADEHRWYRAADLPVPVDSAVIGVSHDRYIYLIGGRSKHGPVNNVQLYDLERNSWTEATPFPGTPVFGHAGGVAEDAIVFVDGAKAAASGQGAAAYVASDECWLGKIDKKDPGKIEWSKLPPHPGPGRFGIVAGSGDREHRILFSGGTTAPHDFKGLDSRGTPAELSPVTFAFELHGNHWETISEQTEDVRADERGIAFTPIGPLIVGGMIKDAAISARVLALPKK
jgi:N-acetylneuraminic acid mutarotase